MTRYRSFVLAFLVCLLLTAASPTVGEAAPLLPRQNCPVNVLTQYDMAGLYQSGSMSLLVHPCGVSHLMWQNVYGQHEALYITDTALPGGGYLAWGYQPDPYLGAYLDSSSLLAIKPAERGYIQIATFDRTGTMIQYVYTLRKVG